MKKINQRKIEKQFSKQNVKTLGRDEITLNQMRIDELKLSDRPYEEKKRMTFTQLFEERMKEKSGETETISMVIKVDIETMTFGIPYGKSVDEFEINKNNVIKTEKLLQEKTTKKIVERTYGPFTVRMKVNHNRFDMYKLAMYTLLKNNFNAQSGENIVRIGLKYFRLEEKDIKHKMRGLKLESYLLSKQKPI